MQCRIIQFLQNPLSSSHIHKQISKYQRHLNRSAGSQKDRFRWPATNVNNLGTSHIQMYMVAHQTIGIDMTSGLKSLTLCVNIRLRLPTKDVEETYVVLIVLKHLLFVHATKYGVINVSRCIVQACRGIMLLCY